MHRIPYLSEHFWKWRLTYCGRLKSLPHKPQQNFLKSECTSWWCLNSYAVQKHFWHSSQTYGFMPSCRCMCTWKQPLRLNFFWQMWHVNQVPSLCDFSRCDLSVPRHLKLSEQCLHEYGFASLWTRIWVLTLSVVLNSFPQKGQWYGLLLLCIWLLCISNMRLWRKLLSHSGHLYGLSPVWILMWIFR